MVKIKFHNPTTMEDWYVSQVKSLFSRSNSKFPYKKLNSIVRWETGKTLDELIILKPNELQIVAEFIKNRYSNGFLKTHSERKFFEGAYTSFRKSKKGTNFIEKVGLKICPYCNRNYIHNFKQKNSSKTTAQLDHFYDKSSYPYLALCMYNLVPCCGTCNLRKSSKDSLDYPIFNPYADCLDDHMRFSSLGIMSVGDIQKKELSFFSEERMDLEINRLSYDNRIENYMESFNIKGLYDNHKDIIANLYQQRVIYSDEYIEKLFKKYEGKLFTNKEDVLKLIACTSIKEDEIHNQPLSKLTRDIVYELKFI